MEKGHHCLLWNIEQEVKEAKDYYRFLEQKTVDKVHQLYESEKFSKFPPNDQSDPKFKPIIQSESRPIIKITRIRPMFGLTHLNLKYRDLRSRELIFYTEEKLDFNLIHFLQFKDHPIDSTLCIELKRKIVQGTKSLHHALIRKDLSYRYDHYLRYLRSTNPSLNGR